MRLCHIQFHFRAPSVVLVTVLGAIIAQPSSANLRLAISTVVAPIVANHSQMQETSLQESRNRREPSEVEQKPVQQDVEATDQDGDGKPKKIKPRKRRRSLGIDPCALTEVKGEAWLDRLHRGLHRAVCDSALWFDDLFGDEIRDSKRDGTYGRLLLGVEYNDRREVHEISRFRARFELPNVERRLSGFVGRGDRDELVGDKFPRTGALPNSLSIPDDDEWLVGLGYSPQRSNRRSSWSYDVGADIEFPVNWYAKARYKRVLFPSNSTMLRLRQTFFWEHDDGWGTTSRMDYDVLLANEKILRWRNIGTVSEGDRGLDWYTELTLFLNRGDQRALAFQLATSGETDAAVPVQYLLTRVIYRRSILREWFFFDIRPGVSYRRDQGETNRELRPVLAIGAEILFGQRPQ